MVVSVFTLKVEFRYFLHAAIYLLKVLFLLCLVVAAPSNQISLLSC